ncbi:hypothetical protein [Sporosarcina pasteurii]|uniref:Uncharacterized protein n=1 Tax=Sporosarcina pasteurii TaxID=1474 RepID=A0A380BEN5_SPOPA|nr:hypothetical protein [Sporosarcina pasteurii]MDS9470397.1 hypothetical protein [Sporosarcina pasteurii]QBQ05901.1 hypothetical protein E2C16_09550 [Sporosarcina pasteurii]SUJ00171.1 Uncharacterised protein [Sporosarcina pasteurii]
MGYILPVNSFQTQQFANRIMAYNKIAEVPRLHKINLNADFSQQAYQGKMQQKLSLASPNSQFTNQGYIYPNPANLSPTIAHLVGKGIAINAYV